MKKYYTSMKRILSPLSLDDNLCISSFLSHSSFPQADEKVGGKVIEDTSFGTEV